MAVEQTKVERTTYTVSAAIDTVYEMINTDKQLVVMAEQMRPGGTLFIKLGGNYKNKLADIIIQYGAEQFRNIVRLAVFRILQQKYPGMNIDSNFKDVKVELSEGDRVKLQDVTTKHENSPIVFECMVTAVDSRKKYIKSTIAVCPKCYREEELEAGIDNKISYPSCRNSACRLATMKPDMRRTVTELVQTVRLQEPLELAKNNSPVSYVAKVRGSNVGTVFMGQKKLVTGIFTTHFDMKKEEHDIVIELIDAEDLMDVKLVEPTEKEIEELHRIAKEPDFLDNLIASFAPHIWGYKSIKESILYQLVGGTPTNEKRGDINMMLVGDPSMAKSQLLRFGKDITQKSMYANGKGSSGAGLTITMVKDEQIGKWMAQAGVYPLCNNGYAYIDEFDKMSPEDRSAMHEVLEQGTASIAKAGIVQTLDAKVTTLAAANPKFGKYNMKFTIEENIDLPPPLLSRMDLIWCIRDIVNNIEDTAKANAILNQAKGKVDYKPMMNKCQLMAYVNYAKNRKPVLSDEATKELLKLYNKLRELSTKAETTPIGIRQLESMIRFCTARAKLLLKDVVDVSDVQAVTSLYKESLSTFGVSMESGTSQTQLFGSQKKSKEEDFWVCVMEVQNSRGWIDPIKLVERMVKSPHWNDDSSAKQYIFKREQNNDILKRDDGYVKF